MKKEEKKNISEETVTEEVKEESKTEEVVEETVAEEVKPVETEVKKECCHGECHCDKKKKNKPNIVVIIMAIIIVALGGVVAYLLLDKDDKKAEQPEQKEEEKKPEENNNKPVATEPVKIDSELSMYSCTYGGYSKTKTDYCSNVAFTIKVEDEDAVLYSNQGDNFLYKDGKIKIYDNKTKNTTELEIETSYDSYTFVSSNNKIIGVFAQSGVDEWGYIIKDKEYHSIFYNINSKALLYKDTYTYMYGTDDADYIQGGIDRGDEEEYRNVLLSSNREKEIKQFDSYCGNYNVKSYNGTKYIIEYTGCIGEGSYSYYTIDGKTLVKDISAHDIYVDSNGNIYYIDNEDVKKINSSGKELVNKYYGNNIMISLNYIIYSDDDKVYIANIDGDNKTELCEHSDKYYYHTMISGYHSSVDYGDDHLEGIYLIVSYDSDDISDEEPGFEVIYEPKSGKVTREELEYVGGYGKPVLYLYPEETTEVTVNFEYEESLTTTYPKFKDEWKVTANPNGDLYDQDGKYYYGLYWEEDSNHDISFKTGFYVEADDAIEFLEEKLTYIGLNDKERNEFIMYWLPILESNGKNLVYFELTEERDLYNKIDINPAPDSLLRVAIHVKKVDKKINIKEQKLTKFNRTGFVAVEWGGVIHK